MDKENYAGHISSLRIKVTVLSLFTVYIAFMTVALGNYIIQTFITAIELFTESKYQAIVQGTTAVFSCLVLVGLCFATWGFYKLVRRHARVLKRLKNGDIDTDYVTVLHRYKSRSSSGHGSGTKNYRLEVLHSNNNKITYYVTKSIYDDIIEGEQVEIEYYKDYGWIIDIKRYT